MNQSTGEGELLPKKFIHWNHGKKLETKCPVEISQIQKFAQQIYKVPCLDSKVLLQYDQEAGLLSLHPSSELNSSTNQGRSEIQIPKKKFPNMVALLLV